jgi:hypothetical protein
LLDGQSYSGNAGYCPVVGQSPCNGSFTVTCNNGTIDYGPQECRSGLPF